MAILRFSFVCFCLWLTACAPLPSHPTLTPLPPTSTASPPAISHTTQTPVAGFSARLLGSHQAQVSLFSASQSPSTLTVYAYNRLTDYLYAPNGDVWLIGGFGAIQQRPNGQQIWHSMQSGLPANYFQAIAVSPAGEVWVGGAENVLLRFDGRTWHDESQALRALPQDSPWWTCRSRTIFGIDFDETGQIWVANGGIHLYTQENGHWKEIPFPSTLLPIAGGGGCPTGLYVKNAQHITIVRQGCCDTPPTAYHFNGITWSQDQNISAFQEHLAARRAQTNLPLKSEDLRESGLSLPFSPGQLLPFLLTPLWPLGDSVRIHRFGELTLALDEQGTLWLNDHNTLFSNRNGRFEQEDLPMHGEWDGINFDTARWLDFPGNPVILTSEGRAIEFSRWFWGETEPGKDYAPLMSAQAAEWNAPWLYFTRDLQGRVWFYLPGEGLVMSENGQFTVYPGPQDLTLAASGGVYALDDGRILVGTRGAIWVFERGQWQKWEFSDTTDIFWCFTKDAHGILYAATDTSVYQMTSNGYTRWEFPMPADSLPPRALLLTALTDGRILYVNSFIVAQRQRNEWRGHLFERVNFSSAALDSEGILWVYSGYNGLLRFDCKHLFP